MKGIFRIAIVIIVILPLINTGCKKEASSSLPTISTTPVISITDTTAITGGDISSDGGSPVNFRGVYWDITSNPGYGDKSTNDGSGSGVFTSTIKVKEFLPGTTYYIRAYATNSVGTAFGQEVTFTTEAIIPKINTIGVTSITTSSAVVESNIISNGGATILSSGICWSTEPNPTISDNKTSGSIGSGSFKSNIAGLSVYTKYYVRAYATNSVGTTYGDEYGFFTDHEYGTLKDIDGNIYRTIQIGTQTWMADNLKTTHYRNGDRIPYVSANTDSSRTLKSGLYNWYNDDSVKYKNQYGALYNWYAVMDDRNLCPDGYHIPSANDWTTLIDFLGGSKVAGKKMKDPNWGSFADSTSGFNALPAGDGNMGGPPYYLNFGSSARFYSSSLDHINWGAPYKISLFYFSSEASSGNAFERFTLSVRCIKD